MSRIYVSQPYREKHPVESVEIRRPTGADLTISERQAIQQLLADRLRTHRLYRGPGGRRISNSEILH